MRLTAVFVILLGLCGAASPDVPDDFRYEIVDGAIVVFGHTLVPGDPLPKAGGCDDCGPFHSVKLVRSPDERWILIISDVHLANFDAWIFDTESKAAPKRIADKRRGRHFTGVEWHSDCKLELSFGGMGYSTSLLFDAESSNGAKLIGDLLLYDAERDVYVRYLHDSETWKEIIEVGPVFSDIDATDRFPIALDNEYLSESRFMIKSVQIDGTSVVVTYDTTARGKVRDVFYPQVLTE